MVIRIFYSYEYCFGAEEKTRLWWEKHDTINYLDWVVPVVMCCCCPVPAAVVVGGCLAD